MMHITEDTPPDMLAGAMDLTVHLPTGRSVKMSVERSTPMMDLLVQIVTAHQLQLSGHILEALEMAPSAGISDKVLPYKPNTPIGALDTQHIRVVPKHKSICATKNMLSGHQPFESTFRLKVHLPRNQLYVTRVSQNVHLEDIMRKVCREKDLDPSKYEFRHPGNLDEVLDPKLTLSDYQITEIYVVSKGTGRLTQAFSTSDIMALRKEEERKQFQAKTGGGVFNLIFKRGKSNPANGSLSSDNRSISPTHSDDSRSVTPPGIQPSPIIKEPPSTERPKPPQRKRRPAPKPPQPPAEEPKIEKPASQISSNSNQSDTNAKKAENGLLICHSRNSSDSSGYHEASILSDNCNTSLPRRPKTMIENEDVAKLSGEHSRSTSNLTKTSLQYKSTSSLAVHCRKKKVAPPPPPSSSTPKPETSNTKPEITSPVVASQPVENLPASLSIERSASTNTPQPAPRRNKLARVSSMNRLNQELTLKESFKKELHQKVHQVSDTNVKTELDLVSTKPVIQEAITNSSNNNYQDINDDKDDEDSDILLHDIGPVSQNKNSLIIDVQPYSNNSRILIMGQDTTDTSLRVDDSDVNLVEANLSLQSDINPYLENIAIFSIQNEVQSLNYPDPKSPPSLRDEEMYFSGSSSRRKSCESEESIISNFSIASTNSKGSKPEIVGVIPKKRKQSNFDTLSRKRGFHIGSSLINMEREDESMSPTSIVSDDKLSLDHISLSSKTSDYSIHVNDCEMNDINEDIFTKSVSKKTGRKLKEKHMNELHGMHYLDVEYKKSDIVRNQSASSLKSSLDSIPGFMNGGNMKKWKNVQDLDDISVMSTSSLPGRSKWVDGDYSDTESVSTVPTNQTPPESISSSVIPPSTTTSTAASTRTSLSKTQSPISEKALEPTVKEASTPPSTPQRKVEKTKHAETEISIILSESKNESDSGICEKEDLELETVWQYQLPSPPKGFRDASPIAPTTLSHYETETLPDSVVTNPELFEKLQYVKDIQDAESDIPSVISEDEKEICNKLTLEHLEKRKSLVYNRELATSLKYAQQNESNEPKSVDEVKSDVIQELEDVITHHHTSNNNYHAKTNNLSTNTNAKPQENFKNVTLDRNLPNFQISSYDTKKEKINIFEDDTIRSNSNLITTLPKAPIVPTNVIERNRTVSNSDKTNTRENIPTRKHTSSESSEKQDEEVFKRPQEVNAYRLKNSFYDKSKNVNATSGINRSGSFSMHSEIWTPSIPVKRSKSQVALNRYKEEHAVEGSKTESLSKSNSLLDMSSGLQSLEVMKKIQNKLSNSKEELDSMAREVKTHSEDEPIITEHKPIIPPKTTSYTITTQPITSWTPPSINLGTWSQRPKTQVMVKEDTDYKFSTKVSTTSTHDEDGTKASTFTSTPSFSSYKSNSVNVGSSHNAMNGVSIKVNGSEAISSQKSGNVVIKIGGNDVNKALDSNSSRFINHITPEGYRKPFGNINKIDRARPHSIAFDNQFDISRVPVVRSVELKKPFKDLHNNKSITQIYPNSINVNDDEPKSLNYSTSYTYDTESKSESKHSNVYSSNESINKPVFRNNSFAPVVKGFRTETSKAVNRKVWSMYGTLPTKPADNQSELNTNKNVPFSQMNLRRTESNKVLGSNAQSSTNNVNNSNIFGKVVLRNNNTNFKIMHEESAVSPPPPPQLPKEKPFRSQKSTETVDARAELLSAIRNFGGKNGLRASKG